MNLMTIKKIISGDRSRPHKLSKGGGWISSFKVARVPTLSPLMIFLSVIGFIPSRFFFMIPIVLSWKFWYAFKIFFFFLSHLSYKLQWGWEREREREREREKKDLEDNQNINDDIINIVEKILKIWIQRHQEISSTIIRVGHMSHPKASESLAIFRRLV